MEQINDNGEKKGTIDVTSDGRIRPDEVSKATKEIAAEVANQNITLSKNSETLDKIEKFVDTVMKEYKDKYYSNPIIKDKIDHIGRVTEITEKAYPGNQLARIAAKTHDIGRFRQFEILGKFDDGQVLHHYLGEDYITRALYQGKLEYSPELDMIRSVVKYHGRAQFIPFKDEIPQKAMELVDVIGRVDGIENGCIGATGYLVREAQEDAKSYKANNPGLDMKSISPDVLEFYKKGEKFDKMKYCKTYADYTLFAAVLAITALRSQDRNLALDAMQNYQCTRPIYNENGDIIDVKQYNSAIEGYDDIFSILVDPKDKKMCMDVLKGFYNNPEYSYDQESIGIGE